MIIPQLFALVSEKDTLTAYPVIVQYSYDVEGYRSIQLLPLVEFDNGKAEIISLVHGLVLPSVPGVTVKTYASEPHTSEAFAIALNNVLVAPKFLYLQHLAPKVLQADTERSYTDFVVTFLFTLRESLQNGGTQRYVFNTTTRMMLHFFTILAATQAEAQQMLVLVDELFESVTDSDTGAITIEKIDAVIAEHQIEPFESEAPTFKSEKTEETSFNDEDNTFFAGLFQ